MQGLYMELIAPLHAIKPKRKVITVSCISWRDRNANHADQLKHISDAAKDHGLRVVGTYQYTGPRYKPEWIEPVIDKALNMGAKYLVFESVDRILRNTKYHCFKNPNAVATEEQFYELQEYLQGIKLATLVCPNADVSIVRSIQRKRGQMGKDNTGGRPRKNRYARHSHETIQQARKLSKEGYSLRQIAKELTISKSTISDWISRVSE